MAKRRNIAIKATYAFTHLVTAASALGLPSLDVPTAAVAFDAAQSEITAAPSRNVAELRFRKRADFRCASSCVSAVVTKSTDCRVDDYSVSNPKAGLTIFASSSQGDEGTKGRTCTG
jgi:hypothetical protein